MKQKNDVLFDLIKSLTKSEKRFLTLNAQFHKGNKIYIKLLEAIYKQNEYNEKLLRIEFKNEPFVKQFGVAKNYLQTFILKQLRNYHSNLKMNIECKNLLIDIEILFWKGQYKLAEKMIIKARKNAQKHDFFLLLEELNYWEGRIRNALLKLNKNYKTTSEFNSKEHIESYLNILKYKELINTAQLLIKESEVVRNDSERKEYLAILKNPLLTDISLAKSYEAKYNYFVLNSVLYKIIGEIKKSELFRKNLLDFLEENPHQIEENPIHYTAAIHNMLTHHLVAHDYENFNFYLEKLKTYHFKMPHERANVFSSLCLFELGYYSETKDYKNAIRFVEETVVNYENVNNLINIEHQFLLNQQAALAYYQNKDFNKALKWINKNINIIFKDLRVDIKASSYILNILTHYELNNFELLPYLVKSTTLFLKSNKLYKPHDEVFLSIFNTNLSSSDSKEFIELLLIKKQELLLLKPLKNQSVIQMGITYLDWIDLKIK